MLAGPPLSFDGGLVGLRHLDRIEDFKAKQQFACTSDARASRAQFRASARATLAAARGSDVSSPSPGLVEWAACSVESHFGAPATPLERERPQANDALRLSFSVRSSPRCRTDEARTSTERHPGAMLARAAPCASHSEPPPPARPARAALSHLLPVACLIIAPPLSTLQSIDAHMPLTRRSHASTFRPCAAHMLLMLPCLTSLVSLTPPETSGREGNVGVTWAASGWHARGM